MSIVGEDAKQITDIVETYKDLVTKIKASDLPLALKGSAMNNLALAKILHHFYNSRLSVKQLDQLDNIITDAVRELFIFPLQVHNTNCDIPPPRKWWSWH